MHSVDLTTDARIDLLRELGAEGEQLEALLSYNRNLFRLPPLPLALPLADEPFVAEWRHYAAVAEAAGSLRALETFLVQLRFPIRAGISQDPAYIQSARKGNFTIAPADDAPSWAGLGLDEPAACQVAIYPTPAGAIATITAGRRADFVRLVQAFGRKNEPDPLPESMGALMISGYRNWHRVQQVREVNAPSAANRILADPSASQDRFILLSRGPYSGVSAPEMQLDSEQWAETSWLIRREHEVCHYFCRRVLGSMRNNIYDEILADYCGIVRAAGSFRADWLLRFLGLEDYPRCRRGGRMDNYRGTPPLSDPAFSVLQGLVYRAVLALEAFDRDLGSLRRAWPVAVLALSTLQLEELAGPSALPLLTDAYARLCAQVTTQSNPRESLA